MQALASPTSAKTSTPEGLHQEHHGGNTGPLVPTAQDAASSSAAAARTEEEDDEDFKLWTQELNDVDSDEGDDIESDTDSEMATFLSCENLQTHKADCPETMVEVGFEDQAAQACWDGISCEHRRDVG